MRFSVALSRVRQAEMVDAAQGLAAIQQTQHDPLAELRRDGRDPHVEVVAADPQRYAPVLRQTFFGDVELAHDLDPAGQQRCQRAAGRDHLAQRAVDAEPHDQAPLLGLDVHVGRAFLYRLEQQRVDEADHGGVVVLRQKVVDRGAVGQRRQIVARTFGDLRRLGGAVAVGGGERGFEGGGIDRLEGEAATGDALGLDERGNGGIGPVQTLIRPEDDAGPLGETIGQARFAHCRASTNMRAETVPGAVRRSISAAAMRMP